MPSKDMHHGYSDIAVDDEVMWNHAKEQNSYFERKWSGAWPGSWPLYNDVLICPICMFGPTVGNLDYEAFDKDRTVRFNCFFCAQCGFYADEDDPHLAELLLAKTAKEEYEE